MKITVYSTTTCPYCVMLKHWLNSEKLEYTEYMVDINPIAAQRMIQESNQRSVPFTTIEYENGTVDKILGFDRTRLKNAFAKA